MVDVVRQRGTVAELHALDPFVDRADGALTDPEVWWCDPSDSALVLGSRQPTVLIDDVAAAAAGYHITRRRSGGGAVVVRPEAVVWIDVVLPHGVAPDDVRGAMVWIGERWRDALSLQLDEALVRSLEVHRGGMVESAWSHLVCFAGVGPGEVLSDGRKLVGLSQRRTRHGLRVQGLVYRTPETAAIAGLLVGAVPDAELVEPVTIPGLEPASIASALAGRIESAVSETAFRTRTPRSPRF